MNSDKLFIIGNGFDLHHSLPTSFSDFEKFLKITNESLFYYLDNFFPGDLWSDFENSLANFQIDIALEDNFDLFPSEDSERDGDKYIFPDKMEEIVKNLTTDLKNSLRDWILNLNPNQNPKNYIIPEITLDSFYLTFNYSDTLEKYYNIPNEKILHIHNKAERLNLRPNEIGYIPDDSEIIIGHSVPYCTTQLSKKNSTSKSTLAKNKFIFEEGKELLLSYFEKSFKNTCQIIKENSVFFNHKFSKIQVIGHSISNVDLPYFEKISNNNTQASWIVSYYGDNTELNRIKTQIKSFKGNLDNVRIYEIK